MTGAILAGGRSRRMGHDKAFIRLGHGTIIGRAVEVFAEIFDRTVIIANDMEAYSGFGVEVFSDIRPGAGSLGGIYTAIKRSAGPYVFVAACDMPWLDPGVIKKVAGCADAGGFDVAVPFINDRYHPMHALYSVSCAPVIEKMMDEGDLKVNSLLKRVRLKTLGEEDFSGLPAARSVENINTPEDLERVKSAPDEKKA